MRSWSLRAATWVTTEAPASPAGGGRGTASHGFVCRNRAPSGLSLRWRRRGERAARPATASPKPRGLHAGPGGQAITDVATASSHTPLASEAGCSRGPQSRVSARRTGSAACPPCGFGRLNSSLLSRFFTRKRLQTKPAPFTLRDASRRGRGWRVPVLTGTPGWDVCPRGPPTHRTGRCEGCSGAVPKAEHAPQHAPRAGLAAGLTGASLGSLWPYRLAPPPPPGLLAPGGSLSLTQRPDRAAPSSNSVTLPGAELRCLQALGVPVRPGARRLLGAFTAAPAP